MFFSCFECKKYGFYRLGVVKGVSFVNTIVKIMYYIPVIIIIDHILEYLLTSYSLL